MADKRREDDYTFKLLVEGPDDLFVIARLRELNHLADNIFIKPCGSVEKAIELFRILIDKEPSIKDMKLVAGKSAIHFYVSGTGQFQINDANWTALTTIAEWSDASARVMELLLTQEMVDCLKGVRGDGWSSTGLLIQGDGMTISKITIL